MAVQSLIEITPLPTPHNSKRRIGALASNVNVSKLTEADFDVIRNALYKHNVLVLPGQGSSTPKEQYELTQRFDPASTSYGHGKAHNNAIGGQKSILHPDLKTVPHQPQVQVIGNGFVEEYEGLQNITLKHPHHRTFHRDIVPQEQDLDVTRFFRWHIDAALYDLNPPRVTSLLAVKVPAGRTQTLAYDDGTGDKIENVPLGTTAFVSGETMYDILSEQDKEFVRTTKVQYAPHPYIWMSKCRALPTGLGLHSEGRELKKDDLPEWSEEKVKILPMVWRNPVTGRLALQVHPCAIEKLHLADGTVIDNIEEVRNIVYRLQRPGISPELVYCHDWKEGDLVLFNNQGVIHSVVGAFAPEEVRLFRQCNLAASDGPLGPQE